VVETQIREYLKPASVEEAWAVLAERGKAAKPIGGGIDAMLYPSPETTTLVDLAGTGLSYVREEDGLAIGATTTFTEIVESPLAGKHLGGVLIEVLEKVASPLQRNLGTIGGTLGSAHPWSDVVPLLLTLDAALVVYDGQRRRLPLTEYLADRTGGARPLIVEVRLPAPPETSACAFEEFGVTGFDVAVLNCACFVSFDGSRCASARTAVGGTPALAARLPAVEESLVGRPLDEEAIDRAAALAGEAIDARDDRRATAAYRRVLARVGVSRCLRRVAERLGGTG
jgi:CO/xanthine dehydrogenase FAD-binding subunit